jgi:hypothetical protein
MNAHSPGTTNPNIARVTEAVAAWNAGDLDRYLTLYHDSIRLHGYSPEPMGKAEVEAFYRMIFATLGGTDGAVRLELGPIAEMSDRVALPFVMSGRHSGPFMGFPATGREFRMHGVTIMQFAAGKVVERWSSADMLSVLVQIGAVALPMRR